MTHDSSRDPYWLPASNEGDPVFCRMQGLAEESRRAVALRDGWFFVPAADGLPIPRQGWKLHVSATVLSATAVMERALPVLITSGIAFKIAATLRHLFRLNVSDGPQIGKFITAYPPDDAAAVALAQMLDRATEGLPGPAVPSDLPLRSGGLIYYRYGAFQSLELADAAGRLFPALFDPAGQLIPDRRGTRQPLAWAADPFASHLAEPQSAHRRSDPRFRMVRVLQRSGRGGVYAVEDSAAAPPTLRVLKEAKAHHQVDQYGRDSRDRLRHEFHLLRRFQRSHWIPQAFECADLGDRTFVVLEHLPGESLRAAVDGLRLRGGEMDIERLSGLALELLDLLRFMHQAGCILRDLTPNNLIVDGDWHLRLIDLELGHLLDADDPVFDGWTPGYAHPTQDRLQHLPTTADDYLALGATLFFAATGTHLLLDARWRIRVEPSVRLLTEIRPDLPPAFVRAVAGLVSIPPAGTNVSVKVLRDELATAASVRGNCPGPLDTTLTDERCKRIGVGVGEWLIRCRMSGHERPWPSPGPGTGTLPVGFMHGAAGIGLFLAELYSATGELRFRDEAEIAAEWCMRWAEGPSAHRVPGLYTGHGAIVWLLLRLAALTREERHLRCASDCLKRVDAMPATLVDMSRGIAGVGLLHLAMAGATDSSRSWRRARELAHLVLTLAVTAQDQMLWVVDKHDRPLGMAQGAAGIGWFLLQMAEATRDEQYLDAARCVGRAIVSAATVLPGGGWVWGAAASKHAGGWWEGSSGICQFLAHLYVATGERWAKDGVDLAALASYRLNRFGEGGLLNGAGGAGAVLDEVGRLIDDERYRAWARSIGRAIELRAVEETSVTFWLPHGARDPEPGLMTGSAGIATLFLRLGATIREGSPAMLLSASFNSDY